MTENISIGKNIVDVSNEKIESNYTADASTEIVGTSSIHAASVPRLAAGAHLPSGNLGSFMQRGVKIAAWGMSSADATNTVLAAIQPYQLYFNNPAAAAKTRNFALARGTITIDIVVTTSPGTYGLYMIAAVPRGVRHATGGDISLTNSYVEMAFQCPHVLINVSAATNGKISLPWLYDRDYATVADLSTNDSDACGTWQLQLYSLKSIASGNGATTPSGTISMYAHFEMTLNLLFLNVKVLTICVMMSIQLWV